MVYLLFIFLLLHVKPFFLPFYLFFFVWSSAIHRGRGCSEKVTICYKCSPEYALTLSLFQASLCVSEPFHKWARIIHVFLVLYIPSKQRRLLLHFAFCFFQRSFVEFCPPHIETFLDDVCDLNMDWFRMKFSKRIIEEITLFLRKLPSGVADWHHCSQPFWTMLLNSPWCIVLLASQMWLSALVRMEYTLLFFREWIRQEIKQTHHKSSLFSK